jgi:hypothetical protein
VTIATLPGFGVISFGKLGLSYPTLRGFVTPDYQYMILIYFYTSVLHSAKWTNYNSASSMLSLHNSRLSNLLSPSLIKERNNYHFPTSPSSNPEPVCILSMCLDKSCLFSNLD